MFRPRSQLGAVSLANQSKNTMFPSAVQHANMRLLDQLSHQHAHNSNNSVCLELGQTRHISARLVLSLVEKVR